LDLENDKDGGKSIVAKTISLLVTPEQAAEVMLATQMGTVNLVMRSPEDDQQTPNSQAKPSELLGIVTKSQRAKEELAPPEPKPVEVKPMPPARDTWTIRIIKPGAVDSVSFEAEDAKTGAASPLGQWKAMSNGGANSPTGMPPAKEGAKAFGPVAQEPPPEALPPQQPTPTMKRDKDN